MLKLLNTTELQTVEKFNKSNTIARDTRKNYIIIQAQFYAATLGHSYCLNVRFLSSQTEFEFSNTESLNAIHDERFHGRPLTSL